MRFRLGLVSLMLLSVSSQPTLAHPSLSRDQGAPSKAPACKHAFKKLNTCVQIDWTTYPKSVEMPTLKDSAEFVLSLKDRKGEPVTLNPGTEVAVKLFMPSMGHGSLPVKIIPEKSAYRVKEVLFSMSGDWEIRIELKKAGKTIDQMAIPFTL